MTPTPAASVDEKIQGAWVTILGLRKSLTQWPQSELRQSLLQLVSAEEDMLCAVVEWCRASAPELLGPNARRAGEERF